MNMNPIQPNYGNYVPLPGTNNQQIGHQAYEVYLELNTRQKAGIRHILESKERVFYAGVVRKVNEGEDAQERILLITNRHVYNIDQNDGFFASLAFCSSSGFRIKRKIALNRVDAITVSMNALDEKQQFVIHVRGERDYVYNGGLSRGRIIKSIFNAHFSNTLSPLGVYVREEGNLSKFRTTNSDAKAKKNKRPQQGLIWVNAETAARGIEWVIFNRIFLQTVNRPSQNVIPQPYSPTNAGFHGQGQGFQGPPPTNVRPGGFSQGGYQAPIQNAPYQNQNQSPNKPYYYIPETQNNQQNQQNFQQNYQPNLQQNTQPQPNFQQNVQPNFQQNNYPTQNQQFGTEKKLNNDYVPNNNVNNGNVHLPNNQKAENFGPINPQNYAAPNYNNVQINSFAPTEQNKIPQNPQNGGFNGQFGQGNFRY